MDEVLDSGKFDYVLDCIDSVTPKVCLIKAARRRKIKIVSSMGAGGKTDPSKVMVRDISKTHNCFLAKQVRKRLKRKNQQRLPMCISNEIQKEESPEND
jgi:tRNA A37 threonylcarbamoyladenosine dehydratase